MLSLPLFAYPKTFAMKKQTSKQILGKIGEKAAISYLEDKGFALRAINQRIGQTEMDIIAQKEDLIIFVEVKARSKHTFGYPESFVSNAQQTRYHEAATTYIEAIGWHKEIRFDILAISLYPRHMQLCHFEDAF